MEQMTIVLLLIYMNVQGSRASQPPEYIGCFPDNVAHFVDKTDKNLNDGQYCLGVCKSEGYRLAATKNHTCKCAKERTKYNVTQNETRCDFPCPGRETEHCGGKNMVSLYDKVPVNWTSESTRPTSPDICVSPKTDKTGNSAKGSQMIALYITLPVVVIVAGSVILIVGLILRHKRKMKEINEKNLQAQDVAITRQTNQENGICNAENSEYRTILDSNDTFGDNKDYDKINGKQATSTSANYSHLPDSYATDNTYSHIGPASGKCMNKTDNTYNTFQF